eukprot:TRINITY_DN8994_c0_g1_i7.p1 TRINITY_DN8994_c0_g1~~TRINITY_DN8994_c0_g1_i7.p1  ORF type:complete len:681 (-),score=203.35 TRINITY_DN8994_c0_g1_i7:168-2210(-)
MCIRDSAYYNQILDKIVDELVVLFGKREAAVEEFLEHLLKNQLAEVMTILIKCPDKLTRDYISKLMSSVLLISIKQEGESAFAYRIDEHEGQRIISYETNTGSVLCLLISAINKDLAQNWTRFEQFFRILYNVAKDGGNLVLDFMNFQRLLTILLDFYIGTESPLNRTRERRPMMGNSVEHAKLQGLVDIVCLLLNGADLTFMQPNSEPTPRKLDEDAKECLKCKGLYIKAIMEGHNTESFNKIIALLSFDSFKFSKMICKTLLRAINDYSKIEVVPYFSLLTQVFAIKDSLQRQRLEWLFGYPSPCKLKSALDPNEETKFGLSLIDTITEDVNEYISPLNYNAQCKSLLTLLWKHRMVYEIHPLKCLLEIMAKSREAFLYVASLPAPTYQYAKYSDWIHWAVSFCINNEQHYMKLGILNASKDKTKVNYEVVQLLKNLDEQWEEYAAQHIKSAKQPGILQAYPDPYIIGKVISEKVLLKETKDNITLALIEFTTEVYNSLPTGKDNKAIPKAYFKKLHKVKTHFNQENDAHEEKLEPVLISPLKSEATVLQVLIKNDDIKGIKVKLNLKHKEGELNFSAPISTMQTLVGSGKSAVAFMATKRRVDEPWGDFALDWSVVASRAKEAKEEELSDRDVYHVMSDDDDSLNSSTQVLCSDCKTINSRKDQRCVKCEKLLEDEF